ncbi:MAG: hypothetical protein COB37_10940 [Kordiimonadales bacterium]|nr:MAG: hypothetical protein COB37_10940 [Kordiimonadales bacterium]
MSAAFLKAAIGELTKARTVTYMADTVVIAAYGKEQPLGPNRLRQLCDLWPVKLPATLNVAHGPMWS